jgi:hypothetical protein
MGEVDEMLLGEEVLGMVANEYDTTIIKHRNNNSLFVRACTPVDTTVCDVCC